MSRATPLEIVYAGPLGPGETCLYRMEALEELGHRVRGVDTTPPPVRGARRIIRGLRRRLRRPADEAGANAALIEAAASRPDVVWIDKGLSIRPATLRAIRLASPRARLVAFSPDDMMNPANQSANYLESIGLYDLHVTTKSFNVSELRALGARAVVMVDNGYSERVHRPVALDAAERATLGAEVGCVSFWEQERENSVSFLARNGIAVRVWGPWPAKRYHPNLRVEGVRAWGEQYTRVICAIDINLAFLRKVNRDLQTTRSVEIPACGAFMLAERSDEHLALFEEGVEAEFFSSDDELLDKVKYYLAHPHQRLRVAAAGRRRCEAGEYGWRRRMADALSHLDLRA